MHPFTQSAERLKMLFRRQRKPNVWHSFTIVLSQSVFDKLCKVLVIPKTAQKLSLITLLQIALCTRRCKSRDPKAGICNTIGCGIVPPSNNLKYVGTRESTTLPTILLSIILPIIIESNDMIISLKDFRSLF